MSTLDRWLATLDDWVARGPDSEAVLRVGLGIVILLAGVHKIVAPGKWAPYLAPVFADPLPVSPEAFMIFLGITEPPFAAMLIFDRYTTVAAMVVAVSIAGTLVALAILWLQTGRAVDVMIRDVAILALGAGVAIQSARRSQADS